MLSMKGLPFKNSQTDAAACLARNGKMLQSPRPPRLAAQEIEEIRRADECCHDADAHFRAGQEDATERITEDEERAACEEARRQQLPVAGAEQKPHHVRHDEPDEADVAADADARRRRERREREEHHAIARHGHADGARLRVAEREHIEMAREREHDGSAHGHRPEAEKHVIPSAVVEAADRPEKVRLHLVLVHRREDGGRDGREEHADNDARK